MLMVLWFHTEVYYFGDCVIPYSMYTENAMAGFFFVSGYLFIPKISIRNVKNTLYSIFRKFFIPYVLFALFLGITKRLFRNDTIDLLQIVQSLLTGNASWFISALIVCQLYLLAIRRLIHQKVLFFLACTLPFLYLALTRHYTNFSIIDGTALSVLFMYAGYLYRTCESSLDALHSKYDILLAVLLIVFKWVEWQYQLNMTYYYIAIDVYSLFLADTLLGCLLMVRLMKRIQQSNRLTNMMEWVGRHTLVFYFLCGGVPMVLSKIANRIIGHPHYILFILVFGAVFATTSMLTYLLYRIPFIRKHILYIQCP